MAREGSVWGPGGGWDGGERGMGWAGIGRGGKGGG